MNLTLESIVIVERMYYAVKIILVPLRWAGFNGNTILSISKNPRYFETKSTPHHIILTISWENYWVMKF